MTALLALASHAPLMLVLWLANMAERGHSRALDAATSGQPMRDPSLRAIAKWKLASFALVVGGYAAIALAGLLVSLIGISSPSILNSRRTIFGAPLAAPVWSWAPRLGLGLWLPALVGMLLLLPTARRLAARFLHLEPENVVHAVSLSFSMLVVINLLTTMAVGLGNLAGMLRPGGEPAAQVAGTLWAQALAWVLCSLVGVGWLSRRTLREACGRLGLTLPNVRQILGGLGIGTFLAVVAVTLLGGLSLLGVRPDADVTELSERTLGALARSPAGILTLGMAAAVGEETLLRGALLPRFRLLPTAILFALLHSSYGLSLSTIVVLGLGLALGLARQRFSTTVAILAHATYNMLLGLINLLNVLPGE